MSDRFTNEYIDGELNILSIDGVGIYKETYIEALKALITRNNTIAELEATNAKLVDALKDMLNYPVNTWTRKYIEDILKEVRGE